MRLAVSETFFEALTGGIEQVLGSWRDLVSAHRDVHVAVVAILFDGDIDGENVACFNDALAGNTVDDFFIDRDTDAAGEAAVAKGAGYCVLAADILVGDLVEMVGSDAGFELSSDAEHGFGGYTAGGADAINFGLGF